MYRTGPGLVPFVDKSLCARPRRLSFNFRTTRAERLIDVLGIEIKATPRNQTDISPIFRRHFRGSYLPASAAAGSAGLSSKGHQCVRTQVHQSE